MKSWYRIKAESENEVEVAIYDEIGFWGITAKDFITDFRKISPNATINLRINSPGGDVFDGLAIYNLIRAHPSPVIATIDGLAASMASVIALAGHRLIMPENAYMMIHNPWSLAFGDSNDMQAMADLLEKLNGTLANVYMKKSGQDEEKIRSLMDEETWMTGKEAKDLGLADEVTDAQKLAARASWKNKFASLPLPVEEEVKEQTAESQAPDSDNPKSKIENPKSEDEIRAEATRAANDRAHAIMELCAKAGVADLAGTFLDRGLTVDEVRQKLGDADKIRARCGAAKLPARADGYIRAGLSVKEVTAELFDILIARQAPEIDNKLGPDVDAGGSPKTMTSAQIYQMRQKRGQEPFRKGS